MICCTRSFASCACVALLECGCVVVRMICCTRSFTTGKHHIFSKPILPEFVVFSFGFVTVKYVGNEFSFPTILGNEFLFPRKRIFVSRKRKYEVDRFAPTLACDDPDTVIGQSMRENSWGQTRVGPRVISLASQTIATTSRRNASILSMPSNSGRILALRYRGGMLVIILIIPPRGYQVVTTNSYDLLITCEFVCVNSHVSIRIISAWTARPHRGLFLPSRNYKFVWLIDYIQIRMWFFFFLFFFFLFSFFATIFALP